MQPEKKGVMEFRYYSMDEGTYLFALYGDSWIREYGKDIEVLHFHNYLEIGRCRFGEGTMEFGDKVREYGGDCFTVIPKNYPHTTNSTAGTKSFWEYIFIDVENFINDRFKGSERDAERLIRDINKGVLFFKREDNPSLAANIDEIVDVLSGQKDFYKEEAEGILMATLLKIAREKANSSDDDLDAPQIKEMRAAEIVLGVLDYVDEHFREEVKIGDIADACYISETHLRRIFHEHVRMGVLEYVNLVRINKACEQMRKTNDNISDIAFSCGFTSLATFNRNFRAIMHKTPAQWRKTADSYETMITQSFVNFEEGWKSL